MHSRIERVSDQTCFGSVCHPSPWAPCSQICLLISEIKHLPELKACGHHLRSPVLQLQREKSWRHITTHRGHTAAGCCESSTHTSVPLALLSGSPEAHLPQGALPYRLAGVFMSPKRWAGGGYKSRKSASCDLALEPHCSPLLLHGGALRPLCTPASSRILRASWTLWLLKMFKIKEVLHLPVVFISTDGQAWVFNDIKTSQHSKGA